MITSIHNRHVKEWRKLHTRKHREKTGKFLIEGFHLIEEAVKTKQQIDTIICIDNLSLPNWSRHYSIVHVNEQVFNTLAQTDTPQGVIAVVNMNEMESEKVDTVILLDALQDPGNVGTIIRTAAAAGFSQVIVGKGTVDVYNDKVIRATQGALFHIPIRQVNLYELIPRLKQENYTIWATTLTNAKNYCNVTIPNKVALIFGNEGSGIDANLLRLADEYVTIPMYRQTESLNVSVVAGILMYYIRNEMIG